MDLIIDATRPVVIIAATGPFILSFYNRSLFLIARLRQYNKDLLDKKISSDSQTKAIVIEQVQKLNKHAKYLTYSIIILLVSVLSNLLTCFFVGFHFASTKKTKRLYQSIGYVFFNIGLVMFFLAIFIALVEIITHLNPVMIEEKKILDLLENHEDSTVVVTMDATVS